MFRRETIALLALTITLAAAVPATAQFGTGAYGSLVWDPDKQCWVMHDREGFPTRLVEERVWYLPGEGGRGGVLVHDNEVYELTGTAPPGGIVTIGGMPSDVPPPPANAREAYQQALEQGNVPTHGPDGQSLSPGARAFLKDAITEEGYGNVGGGPGSEYGDVPADYDPLRDFIDEAGPIASSLHIKDYGTFYYSESGNALHLTGSNWDWQARTDYTDTVVWTGIGTSTTYPIHANDGQPGALNNVTYNVDPTTSQCTSIEFHFNGRDPYVLTRDSGTGLYIDPFPPGTGSGGVPPVLVQQINPNGGRIAWVEPTKKDPPKAKKDEPAPPANVPIEQIEGLVFGVDYEPDFGFGASWHRRLLNDSTFDYEPVDRDADDAMLIQPGIQVSFLGPPPLSDAERDQINGVADEVTALGDEIEERRRNAAEQRQLMAGQQQIVDLLHTRTVSGVDKAREQATDIIGGQFEAAFGLLLANADKIKDAYDRMPDGPAKDQLGKLVNSDDWKDLIAGGPDSVASGAFDTLKFGRDLVTGGIGEAALNFLPDKAQLAIGQIRATYKLSQAASGLIEGGWNADALDDMSEQLAINQRQYHIYMQGTRDLILQQQELAGQVVEYTENAVRGTNGLDRVRFINGVIQELEHNSGGVDVSDQLNELRQLRDDTVIYLPGGEWGTEPVLYHRLSKVKNASARMRMLFEQDMAAKYGPDWDAPIRRQPPGLVMLPPISQGSGTKVEPGKTGGTPKPKPPSDQPPQNVPVTFPDGTTGTTSGPGMGPITMSDGTRIYTYTGGSVERVFQLPSGASVIHHRNGNVEVVAPDGTRTVTMPDGITQVTLTDGTIVTKKPDGTTVTESDDGRVLLLGGDGNDMLFAPGTPTYGDDILPADSDYNNDGLVDAQDYQIFKRNNEDSLPYNATTITFTGLE